jgi:CBS domain-containing protein
MDLVALTWLAIALLAWSAALTAAAVRRELTLLETPEGQSGAYERVALLRRLLDDPTGLGLRLRFSRLFASVWVPLGLALGLSGLGATGIVLGLLLGWTLVAGADAAGGEWTRRFADARSGLAYGIWVRATDPAVAVARPLLRRRRPGDDETDTGRVLAEARASLSPAGGRLGQEERRLLRRLLASTAILVSDIMTRWSRVRTVAADADPAAVIATFRESGHSRLPVLDDGRVTGLLTIKDLLVAGTDEAGSGVALRPVHFLRSEMVVQDAFDEMRASQVHLAVVVDRYGTPVGILTVEDILEEIVGELHDEREAPEEAP